MANEKRLDLIERNALKRFVCEFCNSINSDEPCEPADCRCMYIIDKMPTVDAVEVVHGRWEVIEASDELYKCSACGEWQYIPEEHFAYCPYCGADMRERKSEDEN